MATLEFRSLTKIYGSSRGVEEVSFTVEKGEIFGYLGPNGAGKTTTIRCLMGFMKPTGGSALVFDEAVRPGRATGHARIGYLPGEFHVWPELPGRRALKLLAALNGKSWAKTRSEELAERLELDLSRPAGDLSKGNRQKIGVIAAFQHQPELLILDEPTGGLDPLIRQIVMELIREATQAGATVLLSSHDLGEVAAVCGRAGILREGRLVELAPLNKIIQQGEQRLKIWFNPDAQIPPFPVENYDGVRVIQQTNNALEVAYHGLVDKVIKWAARFPVDHITTPETSLEDAFMQYYGRNGSQRFVSRTTSKEGTPE